MGGLEFCETMAGGYRLALADEERPMSFTVRARSGPWFHFFRHGVLDIEGELDADTFADHTYLQGQIHIDLRRQTTIAYAFHFTANDGHPYMFQGKKTIVWRDLAESMTVLDATLVDAAGNEVGKALLRFDLRSDLISFLRSFRRMR